jgi:hypothetical protein
MKTIPLNHAIDILDRSTAIYVDDESVAFPNLLDVNEEDGLFLSFETEMGGEEKFDVQDNQIVKVGPNGHLILVNTDGFVAKIMPLVSEPVIIETIK